MKSEQAILELLPWYVNGTLSAHECAEVEAWLAQGGEAARRELALYEHLRDQVREDNGDMRHSGEMGWQRLKRQFHREQRRRASWLAPALAASLLVIVVQAGLLSQQWLGGGGELGWQPLSGDENTVPAIQVIFTADANAGQIQALFRQLHLRIVDGPSAAGIYHLRPETGRPDMAELLAHLQDSKKVIAHAALE